MCKKKFFRVENSMKNGIKDIYLPEENSILYVCLKGKQIIACYMHARPRQLCT